MKACLPLLALLMACVPGGCAGKTGIDVHQIDVQDIVRRAASAMQADWAAAPGFSFIQRDATITKGITTSKTQQVFMIEGSDYYMPIAINDQPVTPDQQKLELKGLREEVERRSRESPEQAEKRSEQYRKTREQNGILIEEFTNAFHFTLAGEETVSGHACYVLEAKPKQGYQPPNRTAKVLTGMQGRLWVDQASFHAVKAEADVLKPVSIFGLFARVLPGTKMELEMTPVTDSIWQVSRFAVKMRLSIFWRKSSRETESTFSGYRPASAALGTPSFAFRQ
jgi:hypothetical protein